MNKNIINNKREHSLLNNGDVEHLYTIQNFPIFIGCTEQSIDLDIKEDMVWDICKQSGFIQLRNTINPNLLYEAYHSEAIGDVWAKHHFLFSDIIQKYKFENVIEIGGSNGKFADSILRNNNHIKTWKIVEPSLINDDSLDKRIEAIKCFFDSDAIINNNLVGDIVIHSHTFEHMYDPNNFLKLINNVLSNGSYHIFSIPNLYEYLKNKFINTINFEHTMFLTEDIVDYLLSKNNFKIEDKIYYKNHSIIYVTTKNKTDTKIELPSKFSEYKQMYLSCIEYYKSFVNDINDKMLETSDDVYLFGGHVFSQFLVSLGLNTNRIKCILDNSKNKHNKRLYGTNLMIYNPSSINIPDNSIIILKVGAYREEIINNLFFINNKITFWE